MVLEMKVPSPGESITEVEIAVWLVQDGDYVEKDQAIAEVDSDKATLELPAEESGIITLKAEEGDAVAVGEQHRVLRAVGGERDLVGLHETGHCIEHALDGGLVVDAAGVGGGDDLGVELIDAVVLDRVVPDLR